MAEEHTARRTQDARTLVEQAAPLIGTVPSTPADRELLDRLIADLGAAEPGPDDHLGSQTRITLGALHATRWLHAGAAEADKREALRLLRAARAEGRLQAPHQADSMLLLAAMLVPGEAAQVQPGSLGSLNALFAVGQTMMRGGPAVGDLRDVRGLLTEVIAAEPHHPRNPGLAPFLGTIDTILGLLNIFSGGGALPPHEAVVVLKDLLTPASATPLSAVVDAFLHLPPPTEPVTLPPASDTPPGFPDDLAVVIELTSPGSLTPDELVRLVERIEAGTAACLGAAADDRSYALALAALARLDLAVRNHDPADVERAARHLRTALQDSDTSADLAWLAHTVFPAIVPASFTAHSSRQDAAQAADQLDRDWATIAPRPPAPADWPAGAPLEAARQGLAAMLRLSGAMAADDDEALLNLVDRLTGHARSTSPQTESYGLFPLLLGLAELGLAERREDFDMLRQAIGHLRQGVAAEGAVPSTVRPLLHDVGLAIETLTMILERRPRDLGPAVAQVRVTLLDAPVTHDQRVLSRLTIAQALTARYHLAAGETAASASASASASAQAQAQASALAEAIAELEHARSLLTTRSNSVTASKVLRQLAELYALRGNPPSGTEPRGDHARAATLVLEALRLTAEDVLLQRGTEHGLQSAKAGSGQGLEAAAWALTGGDLETAVACLEAGRALVLQAAASAGTVPERLRAAGADDLARRWEAAAVVLHDEGARVPADTDTYLSVPSDLRRRAVEVLRQVRSPDTQSPDKPADVPTAARIRRRLAEAGVDALVYLLPETRTPYAQARALVIRADGRGQDLPLPGLSGSGRAPLDTYLGTASRRSRALRGQDGLRDLGRAQDLQRDLDGEPRWRDSFEELCLWAGPAVVDRVIEALPATPTSDNPARVVLIPCGDLGLVPWQAAVVSGAFGDDAPVRPLRACDLLVISYAASAAELLRSLARDRASYDTDPVIVVDPSSTLPYAVAEATAIRRAYLPQVRLMGRVDGGPVEAVGTPEDVLAALGGRGTAPPASMVQVTAHGTAATRPTASRLRLSLPSESGACDAPQPALGRIGPQDLTVARILDAPRTSGACASLVVLDCCETDLTSRDHDEALTLTTAFVARGAVDVIGSRWAVDDRTSAVCMIVFHHYLAVHKLAPADALRAAQRWMLGPAESRERVPILDDELAAHHYQALDAVVAWAAFIHQGSPRPR